MLLLLSLEYWNAAAVVDVPVEKENNDLSNDTEFGLKVVENAVVNDADDSSSSGRR